MSKAEPATIPFELDAQSTAETKLLVFTANHFSSSARLEHTGFGSSVIKVHERTSEWAIKPDFATMLCLRNVLNRWYEKEGPSDKERR